MATVNVHGLIDDVMTREPLQDVRERDIIKENFPVNVEHAEKMIIQQGKPPVEPNKDV